MLGWLDDLQLSTWTAAAVGALFESGVIDALGEPRTPEELAKRCRSLTAGQIRRCLDVAAVNGLVVRDGDAYRLVEAALPLLEQPVRIVVPADLRSALMQGLSFLDASGGDQPQVGWLHEDPRILRGQGEGSAMIVRMMKRRLVPELDGLGERLEGADGRFLDVGVGVGALAIEMCRTFPNVKVVGLDIHEPALAIARESVASAKLGDRVELRKLPIEELRDESAFDLAWFPSFFIPTAEAAAKRICAALRPGGWVVCALVGVGGTEKQNATWALIGELWGGVRLSTEEAVAMLREAGFSTVRELPSPAPGIAFVAGQR